MNEICVTDICCGCTLQDANGKVIEVYSIDFAGVNIQEKIIGYDTTYQYKFDEVFGISLTEEYLFEFGYSKMEEEISDPSNSKTYVGYKTDPDEEMCIALIDGAFWFYYLAGDDYYNKKILELPFLHTLQNFYPLYYKNEM